MDGAVPRSVGVTQRVLKRSHVFSSATLSTDFVVFFFQAEDGIRDLTVTGVQTCALPICPFGSNDDPSAHDRISTKLGHVGSNLAKDLTRASSPARNSGPAPSAPARRSEEGGLLRPRCASAGAACRRARRRTARER